MNSLGLAGVRRSGVALVLSAFFLPLALEVVRGDEDERESLPEGAKLTRLEVYPERIDLANPFAYGQLIVTGVLDGGERFDATRVARASGGRGLVEVSSRGTVHPLGDGEGQLILTVGEHEVAVPLSVSGLGADYTVSYLQDVMPTMAKLGCNQGTCHGAAKGKNGFKLSLRGYDPLFDHRALTDDLQGRRFNKAAPDQSLFLQKLRGDVPHVGGVLSAPGERYYTVLRGWVAGGAVFDEGKARVVGIEVFPKASVIPLPGMKQQFKVVATYGDGATRDVTLDSFYQSSDTEVASSDDSGLVEALRRGETSVLVRYEGNYAALPLIIMGDRSGFAWRETPEYNYIDTFVYKKLREVKALPSDVCTDAEFVRRVFIDLTGVPPGVRQVRAFLADGRDSRRKREELVDRLIGSTEFVEYWTNKWSDLLQVNRKFLGPKGAGALREWVQEAVASNTPYDEFVYSILTAKGSTLRNPPAAYFKVLREADVAMENTTQLFLGVRFNCNKCHDHPFERWTQDNYWELASFFAQVGRKNAPDSEIMPQIAADQTEDIAFEEIIFDKKEGEVSAPSGKAVQASFPYRHEEEAPTDASRREQVARWLASSRNDYFATSFVNRLWSYFLGVGFIEPVDDLRAGNPPTNPELLARLTQEFIDSGFDSRHMIRLILKSRTYQHSLATNEWNEDDTLNFSHAKARRLPAEVLYDAIHVATGTRSELPGMRRGSRAAELLDSSVKLSDGFLDLFGKPPRESACECERTTGMSLGQSLSLVNGPTVADAIRNPENGISDLIEVEPENDKVVEELFLSFLCRLPTKGEVDSLLTTLDYTDRANLVALPEEDKQAILDGLDAWEEELNVVTWEVFEPEFSRSAGGATLTKLEDGSILASGEGTAADTYTVVGSTGLKGVTGVRLEVLPHESLPKNGPGRNESGQFMLSEFSVAVLPLSAAQPAAAVKLQNATSKYRRRGGPERAIDGINDDRIGWGFRDDEAGQSARAVFEFAEDVGSDGGTLLTFTLDQLRETEGQETIGRFRLWLTTTPRPVRASTVPEEIAEILYVPKAKRSVEQQDELFAYFMKEHEKFARTVRRAAAQDIAWALVNSPAFLFNR